MPCLDRQIRIVRRPTASARGRRLPSGNRLRRDPHGQTATLLQRLVILAPVLHLILRFRELVASRGVGLVGHRCLRGEDLSLSCHLPGNSYWRIYAPTPSTISFLGGETTRGFPAQHAAGRDRR